MRNINKSNLLQALIVIVTLLAIPTLLINNLFYFNEGNDHVQLTITNSELVELNQIDNLKGVSRIDRENSFVIIEKQDLASVQNNLNEKNVNSEGLLIEEVYSSLKAETLVGNYLVSLIAGLITLIGFSFVWSYYTNIKKLALKDFLNYIFVAVTAVGVATLVQITALSVFSRFYQIRFSDVSSIALPFLITSFLYAFALIAQRNQEIILFSDFLVSFRSASRKLFDKVYIIVILLFIPLLFGLGTQFVLPAIFVSIAILVSFVSNVFVVDLFKLKNNLSDLKKKINVVNARNSDTKIKAVKSMPKAPKKVAKPWKRSKKKAVLRK